MKPSEIIGSSFMNWNMPYGALRSSRARAIDHFSPASPVPTLTPPSDVFVATPAAVSALSPPADSPSGLSKALQARRAVERAQLFVQGKHEELIKSMNKKEQLYEQVQTSCGMGRLI
jgi:hypothetical protein